MASDNEFWSKRGIKDFVIYQVLYHTPGQNDPLTLSVLFQQCCCVPRSQRAECCLRSDSQTTKIRLLKACWFVSEFWNSPLLSLKAYSICRWPCWGTWAGCQREAGTQQGWLVSCWHLSYVFVYQEQGSTAGERWILSREWVSRSFSKEAGLLLHYTDLIPAHTVEVEAMNTLTLQHTKRNTHTLQIHDGKVRFSYFAVGSLSPIIKRFLEILSQTKVLQWFITIECHDRWSSGVKILFV